MKGERGERESERYMENGGERKEERVRRVREEGTVQRERGEREGKTQGERGDAEDCTWVKTEERRVARVGERRERERMAAGLERTRRICGLRE